MGWKVWSLEEKGWVSGQCEAHRVSSWGLEYTLPSSSLYFGLLGCPLLFLMVSGSKRGEPGMCSE